MEEREAAEGKVSVEEAEAVEERVSGKSREKKVISGMTRAIPDC
jgi:hypothetical protein